MTNEEITQNDTDERLKRKIQSLISNRKILSTHGVEKKFNPPIHHQSTLRNVENMEKISSTTNANLKMISETLNITWIYGIIYPSHLNSRRYGKLFMEYVITQIEL